MKARLIALALLVATLATLGVFALRGARNVIPARADVADSITMENGIETHHFTVTAKRK
jgi:hypothetical protein